MSQKRNLIFGTLLLTTASFISRFIGFFFRIFLSRTFHAEQIGIYQLIFPIYALCFSITSAGIELALSRCVAKETALGNNKKAAHFLYISLFFSLALSIFFMKLLQMNASHISIYILGDLRCEQLLSIVARALPFASIHSCIYGYYLGLKHTKITAFSQLIEQSIRVCSTILLCQAAADITFAVYGIILSEFFSALFYLWYYSHYDFYLTSKHFISNIISSSKELFSLAVPLTANRVLTNLLQTIESVAIPLCLQQYGYTNSHALSTLGVLTGIVLPCIFFPSAITNSISTLVLPTVTELQTSKDHIHLKYLIRQTFSSCIFLGISSCLLFFSLSDFIGQIIFNSSSVSDYLKVLCWICPFLYTNTTLAGIINGLGKTTVTFLITCFSISVRIAAIILFVPRIGINAYLHGLLLSQFLSFSLQLGYLIKNRGC